MMRLPLLRPSLSFLSGLVLAAGLFAQSPSVEFPAPSPACTLKQRVGLTDITIVYSRPGVKGRTVFGGIVPYGEVWRTGANASTKITFSTDVQLNGSPVPAGTYALYTIPGETQWTVIIDKDTHLFGAFNYDPKNDLVRFTAEPKRLGQSLETFTIEWSNIGDESAILNLMWEKTRVPIELKVDFVPVLVAKIEAKVASGDKLTAGFYYQSAMLYFDHNLDQQKALAWLDAGLAMKPGSAFELLHLKAQILARQGDKEGAIAAAEQSSALALKAEGPTSAFARMDADLISSLK